MGGHFKFIFSGFIKTGCRKPVLRRTFAQLNVIEADYNAYNEVFPRPSFSLFLILPKDPFAGRLHLVSCCFLAKPLLFYSYYLAKTCNMAAGKEQAGTNEIPLKQEENSQKNSRNKIPGDCSLLLFTG